MDSDNKEKRSIGIIGAGVTGLAAGCYALMNGYQTTIFEAHKVPGGLCTSWKKGDDYTIDGCLEWLVGVAPYGSLHQGWLELGALQGKSFVDHEIYITYEGAGGKVLNLYSNVDRLEKHLLELSPQDRGPIHRITSTIRLFSHMDRWQFGWTDIALFPIYFGRAAWAFLTPMTRFAQKFKDPFLRDFFGKVLDLQGMPVGLLCLTLAWHNNHNGGYPIGGSLEFAKSIEKRFLDLGGRIHYGTKVGRILQQDGKAAGLALEDGQEFYFDRLISAGDGHLVFEKLLEGRFNGEKLYRRFQNLRPFNPLVQVAFGVKRDLSTEPHALLLPLEEPLVVGGKPQDNLYVRHYAYDPTLAPPGKTVLKVSFQADYDYWKRLHADPVAYEGQKHSLARAVLARLEKRFPGISKQVEVTDVATPTTWERYTHNWRGSIEGWLPDLKSFYKPMPKVLEGLKGLYFAGQWVQPGGGLPTCLMTGKGIVQKICKEDGRHFVTNLPKETAAAPKPVEAGSEEPSLAEEIFAGRD